MSVVYEQMPDGTVKAHSDQGRMVIGGSPRGEYAVAYDPAAAHREYEESENFIPTSDLPPGRTFKRSYLAQWIYSHEKWDAFQQALSGFPEFKFLWDYSTEFDEFNPSWPQAISVIQSAIGLSPTDLDEMLQFGETGRLS